MQPSDEQAAIIEARRGHAGESLRVVAFAGCAKTTTLELAAAVETAPVAYLAFSKAVQRAAERRFPRHVLCRTMHSIAYQGLGMRQERQRLEGRTVAELLDLPAAGRIRPARWGHVVLATVRSFCHSADRRIGLDHVTDLPPGQDNAGQVVGWAQKLWRHLADPGDATPIEHGVYLKRFQLGGGRLPGHIRTVYLDEAHDSNPVTLAILAASGLPVVAVGDPWQSIYAFRGAVDAMQAMTAPTLHISCSWRFGPALARVATSILQQTGSPPTMAVRGRPDRDGTIERQRLPGPCTVLCRTNAALFEAAISDGDPIHIVGGGEQLIRLILGGWRLMQGEEVLDVPGLLPFASFEDLREHVQDTADPELRLLVQIVEQHLGDIPALVDDLRRRLVPDMAYAERVLSTAHKAKGLEWDQVVLEDDFPTLEELDETDAHGRPCYTAKERDQELHLLYVAATRARSTLVPNEAVRSCALAWRRGGETIAAGMASEVAPGVGVGPPPADDGQGPAAPPARIVVRPQAHPAAGRMLAAGLHAPGVQRWLETHVADRHAGDEQAWVEPMLAGLKKALAAYKLDSRPVEHRLTPNALLVRFKGSDRMTVKGVERRLEELRTSHALDVIDVRAGLGEVVLALRRPERLTLPLAQVWRQRLAEPAGEWLLLGVREEDGGLLRWRLADGPHMLIAGETGSGKGVLVQNLLLDLAATHAPDQARLVMVDPKMVDYGWLERLPHLDEEIVTTMAAAVATMQRLVAEMERRYRLLQQAGVAKLDGYNARVAAGEQLPRLFLFHDELADWTLEKDYLEAVLTLVGRLAGKARAAGIHLVLITQRPEQRAIPPLLKANMSHRIALRVGSMLNSKLILDEPGAERLLGKGHLAARLAGESRIIRAQVPFLTQEDLGGLVEAIAQGWEKPGAGPGEVGAAAVDLARGMPGASMGSISHHP